MALRTPCEASQRLARRALLLLGSAVAAAISRATRSSAKPVDKFVRHDCEARFPPASRLSLRHALGAARALRRRQPSTGPRRGRQQGVGFGLQARAARFGWAVRGSDHAAAPALRRRGHLRASLAQRASQGAASASRGRQRLSRRRLARARAHPKRPIALAQPHQQPRRSHPAGGARPDDPLSTIDLRYDAYESSSSSYGACCDPMRW
mmetsp:Transcript_54046/g.117855  ORF Transcript_54046/g.117855 Transcript_54046/m.117855 type:complete len:208 (-) Transcript_54046:606-1229(-)